MRLPTRPALDKRFDYLCSLRGAALSADDLMYPQMLSILDELCAIGLVAYMAFPVKRYVSRAFGYHITDAGVQLLDLYETDRETALCELYARQQSTRERS